MSQIELEKFLGRLITDAAFREKAARSLATSCYDEGIILSRQEVALLETLDFSLFDEVGALLDHAIRRS